MSVTIEEIDKFVDRLMDETAGEDYSERLGQKVWYVKRRIADKYGCPTCRPGARKLYNVEHNTVNIELGKEVVDPHLYEEGIKLVVGAYQKYRERHHHSANVKINGRIVHVVTDDPDSVESFKQAAAAVRLGH